MKKLNKSEKIAIEDTIMEDLKNGSLKTAMELIIDNSICNITILTMYDILEEMAHKGLLDRYNVGSCCVYGVYGMDKTKALRKEIIKIINSMNEQRLEILLAKLI
jgi:hypothetical protein